MEMHGKLQIMCGKMNMQNVNINFGNSFFVTWEGLREFVL